MNKWVRCPDGSAVWKSFELVFHKCFLVFLGFCIAGTSASVNLADVPCGQRPALFKSGLGSNDRLARGADLLTVSTAPLLKPGAQMFIVGGLEALRGEHPYMATLKFDGRFICGATVIARRHVLSAAHCVSWYYSMKDASKLKVLVKANDLTRELDPLNQEMDVEDIVIHPQFRNAQRQMDYDVAVIVLKDAIVWDDFVQPICLHDGAYPRKFTRAAVTGWGVTRSGGSPSSIMRSIDVPVIPTWLCRFLLFFYLVNERHICAGGETGRDSCQGDSGGPLTLIEADGDVQVGIVSEGFFCGLPFVPAKYTRISSFLGWIREQVDKDVNAL